MKKKESISNRMESIDMVLDSMIILKKYRDNIYRIKII